MSRRFHYKERPAGAFGLYQRREVEPEAEAFVPLALPDDLPPALDDGIAYEKLGPAATEVTAMLQEWRQMTVWFGASPFMVVFLKEIVRWLHSKHGMTGIQFLSDLGIRELSDLHELDGLSGETVCDLLEEAFGAVTEHKAELGI